MKRILVLASLMTIALGADAQTKSGRRYYGNNAGSVLLNAGVGLSNWGIPVYGGVEAYVQDFTLGGVLSYRRYYSDWRSYRYDFSATTLSGIVNYHFNRVLRIPSAWDFYFGANIGYNFEGYSRVPGAPEYTYRRVGGLAAGLQLGGRYYFSRTAGINLEVGGGMYYLMCALVLHSDFRRRVPMQYDLQITGLACLASHCFLCQRTASLAPEKAGCSFVSWPQLRNPTVS